MSPAPDSIVSTPSGAENIADRTDLAATALHTDRLVAEVAHRGDGRKTQITGKPVIFLCRDYVLDQILDEIGRRLERDRCEGAPT
jgi:hypothetical protein